MRRFAVRVDSDDSLKPTDRLEAAGIPTIGPAYAEYVGSPESGTLSRTVTAVVDAETENAALSRVREIVPDGELGPAEPYGEH
jgi:hypothetical protein